MTLQTAVIYGSVRGARRQGIKAARFIVRKLEARGHAVTLIDPLQQQLPLLDRMYKEFEPGEAPQPMQEIGQALRQADGFIIVSGEYNHAEPAALKNLLDHFQTEYLYKPSGIVTYSAGPFGGVRALMTLRAILAELGTAAIPSSFPVPKISAAFDDDGNALDAAFDRRIERFLNEFDWYAKALRNARIREKPSDEAPAQQKICRGEPDAGDQ